MHLPQATTQRRPPTARRIFSFFPQQHVELAKGIYIYNLLRPPIPCCTASTPIPTSSNEQLERPIKKALRLQRLSVNHLARRLIVVTMHRAGSASSRTCCRGSRTT